MGYLRLVRSEPLGRSPAGDCLDTFDRELDYLFMTLQRFGAAPAEIEDFLQEIFVVLHRHWPTLDMTRPLRPWLFGVAFRVTRAHRRRRAREVLCCDLVPDDVAPSPEVGAEDQESLALLWAALERVPSARRSVLVMHDLEGLEIVDIAQRLGMTKIGIYTRLYKGRKELASAVRRLQNAGAHK